MSNNHRELTGREKQRIKKLITSLCANHDKEYGCLPLDYEYPMFGICYTNSALCSYFRKSVLPEDAGWKLYSPAHQPPTVSNAANRSLLMGNGYTVRENVPKKHAASRPQHGCVSTGRRNIGFPQNRRFCGKRRRSEMSKSCRLRRDERYVACNDDM